MDKKFLDKDSKRVDNTDIYRFIPVVTIPSNLPDMDLAYNIIHSRNAYCLVDYDNTSDDEKTASIIQYTLTQSKQELFYAGLASVLADKGLEVISKNDSWKLVDEDNKSLGEFLSMPQAYMTGAFK